jgi:hypothetical protein
MGLNFEPLLPYTKSDVPIIRSLEAGMKRKRGNPSWGRPEPPQVAAQVQLNSFEQVVRKLQLMPEQYIDSIPLKDWVWRNKDQKYVPANLLKAWNFEARCDL